MHLAEIQMYYNVKPTILVHCLYQMSPLKNHIIVMTNGGLLF